MEKKLVRSKGLWSFRRVEETSSAPSEEVQNADLPFQNRLRGMQQALDARKSPSEFRTGVQEKDSLLDRAASRTAEAISSLAEMIEGKIVDLSKNYANGTPDVPFEALMTMDQDRHPQPELKAKGVATQS